MPLLLFPLGVVLAGVAAAGVSVLALMIVAPPQVHSITAVKFAQTSEKIHGIEWAREFRLPTDPAISMDEVTEAFVAASDVSWEFDGPSVESIEGSPLAADASTIIRGPRGLSMDAILPAAARGLTAAERRYLQGFTADPRQEILSRVARAGVFDELLIAEVQAGTPILPSESSTHWEVPIPKLAHLRQFAYSKVAEAGLHLDAGDADAAERALREPISLGFLLVDEGSSLIAPLLGAVMVGITLDHLEVLFEVTDQDARHARFIAARPNSESPEAGPIVRGPQGWDLITDRSAPRQLRFEVLGLQVVRESCGSPNAILFGLSEARLEYAETTLRSDLVRTEREARMFDAMLEWETRMANSDWRGTSLSDLVSMNLTEVDTSLGRGVAGVLGLDRIEACWSTLAVM